MCRAPSDVLAVLLLARPPPVDVERGTLGRQRKVEAFDDARPDDGKLELGVVTAEGLIDWGRMLARAAVGTASKSPFAQTTKGRSVKVKLNRKVLYELDGGDRTKVKAFKVKVEAGAITVCVPKDAQSALKGGSHAAFTDHEHARLA